MFCTGSISLNSSGISALYVTAGTVVPTAGYAVPAAVPAGAVVTTSTPYRPMGPWIEGCVPDSIRYVPGLSAGGGMAQVRPQHSGVVAPAATSVENDCTRGPCGGGVPTPVSGDRKSVV